jgi:hypothetical protein
VQDLRRRRYNIFDAVSIMKLKPKEPLPIFILMFDRTEEINKILEE